MFFSLQVLGKRAIDFGEEFRPGVIDLGSEARQRGTLTSSGRATLVTERHGHKGVIQDIRVVGTLATAVEQTCARCLEPVVHELSKSFDLLYRPLGSDAGREEMSVTQVEAEISYYQGDGLLLEDVLREQTLLALPMRVVCSEECKGLCRSCGHNLNLGPCSCPAPAADPCWTALQGLREKLER